MIYWPLYRPSVRSSVRLSIYICVNPCVYLDFRLTTASAVINQDMHFLPNMSPNSVALSDGPRDAKHVFGHMRSAKAQIRLRIRAVWSGPSMPTNRVIGHCRMYQWRANARVRFCACMGWIWIYAFCACLKTHFWRGPTDLALYFTVWWLAIFTSALVFALFLVIYRTTVNKTGTHSQPHTCNSNCSVSFKKLTRSPLCYFIQAQL